MQFRCPHMTLPAGMTSHLTTSPLATDQTSPFYRSALPLAFSSGFILSAVFMLSLLLIYPAFWQITYQIFNSWSWLAAQKVYSCDNCCPLHPCTPVADLHASALALYQGPLLKVVARHSLLRAGTSHSTICIKISTSLETFLESQAQLSLIAGCIFPCACWYKLCACRHQWQWQIHRATLTI